MAIAASRRSPHVTHPVGETAQPTTYRPGGTLVRVDSLTRTFESPSGALNALEDISLDIRTGEFLAIVGPSGCGKTTLLATLLSLVHPAERLVVVEDATELRPAHPHVVGLEARPPNVEGAGAIELRTLVRQALRMRPDRLVVGEVRDGSVVELLAALNTGHAGGCGTLHANSAADVVARVEALALAAGLSRVATHSQLASAIEAVSPAPFSTASSAPSPMNFFTVSGVAATRVSPAASSFNTAMRMPEGRSGDQKDDDGRYDHGDDRTDLEEADETFIGFVRCLHFLFRHDLSPLPVPRSARPRAQNRASGRS